MGLNVFLGEPPARIKSWLMNEFDKKGPLFFEANEPGASVAMLCWDEYNWQPIEGLKCHLQVSTDKMATWQTYNGWTIDLDECSDGRAYFRADPSNPNINGFHIEDWDNEEVWTHYFKTVGSVKAGGNIQFLLESTGTRPDVPVKGFYCLFGFEEYNEQTGEPEYSCASLTQAPELPATTLASNCYSSMFNGCTKLASIDVSFTSWSSNATTNWVKNTGTEATGTCTFTCPSSLTKTRDNSHIPPDTVKWIIVEK